MDILQGKDMCHSINLTFITLISKKENSEVVSDFRPISLCNVHYNLVSKVIYSNRLKSIMPQIISRMKNFLIFGRLIIDNILVAYELRHSMKYNKKKKVGEIVIKLETSKAYNRIKWPYLEAVLTSLGFIKG